MDNTTILKKFHDDADFTRRVAEVLRAVAATGWGVDTAHPDFADERDPASSRGQCYVTSMMAAHYLKVEMGLDARVALGSLWTRGGRRLAIPFHGWVVIGDPLCDPVVVDLTADQNRSLPGVLVGPASRLADDGVVYHYQEVREVGSIGGPAVGRWLALMARTDGVPGLRELGRQASLDLSAITDGDVRVRLSASLAQVDDVVAQRLLRACSNLAETYSFSDTRTYPRPDHPDPRKRRSLSFLLVGILVSLRTTLENEQRAMDAVLSAYPDDDSLHSASQELLEALVRPAGMPKKRAATIKRALSYCESSFGRDFAGLLALDPSERRTAVLEIPGFGPKATDCFLSIGLGVPAAVVDVNVFRAFRHLMGETSSGDGQGFDSPRAVERVRLAIDQALPGDVFLRQIVHTLMLLYGRNRDELRSDVRCSAGDVCLTCSGRPARSFQGSFSL